MLIAMCNYAMCAMLQLSVINAKYFLNIYIYIFLYILYIFLCISIDS